MSGKRRIFLTGGAGYVGNVLTPRLLAEGYAVTVYDLMLFGSETLPLGHRDLTVVAGDIRDTSRVADAMAEHDVVLHLACISNDASFELDERLSTTINYECFEPLVAAAKSAGIKRFVYCSSSSVYGVSDAPEVSEDHPLVPLTLYNKFKGLCESLLFKHQSPSFECVTIRPATVCGYSPRCRLDLTVNILTNHAVNAGQIKVFGGDQKRPNLHIEDMVDAYLLMIEAPAAKIAGETFNIGHQNLKVSEIAAVVRDGVLSEYTERDDLPIIRTESSDNRSYHINSEKIASVLGYRPRRGIEDAVRDLCRAFRAGKLPDSMSNDWYYNVRYLKARNAA